MRDLQNKASKIAFSAGIVSASPYVIKSTENVKEFQATVDEFAKDADFLFNNAGDMLTTG